LAVLAVACSSSPSHPVVDGAADGASANDLAITGDGASQDGTLTDGAVGDGSIPIDGPMGVLLTYRYGNQITGSELTVHDDGRVEHIERTCCPPTSTPVTEADLDGTALAMLRAQIAAVAAAGTATTDGHPTSAGSSNGELYVYHDGLQYIVRTISRNPAGTGPSIVVSSTAAEASAILSYVNSEVDEDMP
jgi:hypothetical protein